MRDRIRIAMCDRDIIDKLATIFEYTGPIYTKIRDERKPIYELNINNVELAQKFIRLGCIINKTHFITFPDHIPEDLLPHFFRGILEGDGSLRKKDCSITGNLPLLSGIKDKAIKHIGLKEADFHFYCRHPKRNNNIRSMMLTKRENAHRFLDWIYKNSAEHMRMDRKFTLYTQFYCVDNGPNLSLSN